MTMVSPKQPEPANGLSRIWKALCYSLSGIRLAARDEAAFRQEILLVAVLSVVCLFLPIERWLMGLLLLSHILVLIVELVNTAVEAVVDHTFPGLHEAAKKAKDCASAAVLLSLLSSAGIWSYALSTIWMN